MGNDEFSNKIYFPGLNGLRFFAALLVIVHHVEFVKEKLSLPNHMNIVFFQKGHLGVVLFFVLSGFLITYLLLLEKKNTGKIAIKQFYFKRILRIWPLYYLVVLGVFIFVYFSSGASGFAGSLTLYILILPNLAYVMFPPVEGIYHLWTIGVEEQFYLFWPVKINFLKKYLLTFLVFFLFLFPMLRITLLYFYKHFSSDIFYVKFTQFVLTLQLEGMAAGGIVAYLLFYNYESLIKFIFSIPVQGITCILIMYTLFFEVPDFYFNSIFTALLFGILIVNVGANKNSIITLENKLLNFLGKISYGLYIYHLIIIYLALHLLGNSGYVLHDYLGNFILHVSVICFTITVSTFSYYLIEKKFLAMKDIISDKKQSKPVLAS